MSTQNRNPSNAQAQAQPEWAQRLEAKLDQLLEALQSGGQAAPLGQPTFCGFVCSWTQNAEGYPDHIVEPVTGAEARLREKQGDRWYSAGNADDGYRRVFTAPKSPLPEALRVQFPDGVHKPHSGAQAPQERRNGHKPPQTPQKAHKPAPAPQERRNGHHAPAQEPQMASGKQLSRIDQLGEQVYGRAWPAKQKQHLARARAKNGGLQTYTPSQAACAIKRLEAMAAERKQAPPKRERGQVGFLPRAQAVLTRAQAMMEAPNGR